MKNFTKSFSLMVLFAMFMSLNAQELINCNPDPNGEPWIAGGLVVTPEIEAKLAAIPILRISPESEATTLPSKVDNSIRSWFRPIFNQGPDGCCGQAAGVGYAFTYEVNRLRNLPSDTQSNQYPTHFTYNFLNEEFSNRGTWPQNGWDIINQCGVPSSEEYGGMYKPLPFPDRINVWETGYEHYYHALTNKVILTYEKELMLTSIKIDKIKHWINDHCQGDTSGGVAVFCANIYNAQYDTIFTENDDTIHIVKSWGNDGLHALTIVGYDDDLMFDFNGDGQFTNPGNNVAQWERGAFKIANSWGTGYKNDGFVYMPYRLVANTEGDIYNNEIYCLTVTESYSPELMLKMNIQHPNRRALTFYADYSTDAAQPGINADSAYIAFNWSKLPQFDYLAMQGLANNNDPIELGLDFGQFFKNQLDNGEVGKVYFVVEEDDNSSLYNGIISDYSLIDYRWNETFELPYQGNQSVFIANNGHTRLGINYHLLPFEKPIQNDFTVTSDRVVRRTVTVKDGTFTLNDSVRLDMYGTDSYDCNLVFYSNSNLVIGDNAVITAKQGNCEIEINCDVEIGNNVKFIAENGATLKIKVNNGRIVHLSNCTFINASLEVEATEGKDYAYIPEISVVNCNFTSIIGVCEYEIKVYGYNYVTIMDNIINGIGLMNTKHYTNGIIIHNSGTLSNNSRIYRNEIKGCTEVGLTLLAGRVNVIRNVITSCGYGVRLLNNSIVNSFNGSCGALNPNQTQYIHDNNYCEVQIHRGSMPQEFRYNNITNSNNAWFVQYDDYTDRGLQIRLDLEYNNWGNLSNSQIEQHFTTNNTGNNAVYFDYLPKWNWGECYSQYDESDIMMKEADSLQTEGLFSSAKLTYKEIIEMFPTSVSASNAMKKLFQIEALAGNDYASLQSYYLTNNSIQGNEDLSKMANVLANKCDEELKNYNSAISWYENVITDDNTPYNDSIFARIDLGYLYLKIEEEGNKSITGNLQQYIPKSREAHSTFTDYALSQLKFENNKSLNEESNNYSEKLNENNISIFPNPFDQTIMIIGEKIELVKIYNAMGQCVLMLHTNDSSIHVDLNNINSGVYFVNVIDKNGTSLVKKLIKN